MILYIVKRFDNSFFKYNFFTSQHSLFKYFIKKVNENKHIRIETKKLYIFETEEHSRFNLVANEYKEAVFSTFYFKEWHEEKKVPFEKYTVLRNRMALISMFNNIEKKKISNIERVYNVLKSSSENINYVYYTMNRK